MMIIWLMRNEPTWRCICKPSRSKQSHQRRSQTWLLKVTMATWITRNYGFPPEVLVFEVLGQIHLRFWLVDRYLVLGGHLRVFHLSMVRIVMILYLDYCIYWQQSPSQRQRLFFSAPFDSSDVSWGEKSFNRARVW